jgi:hypothetical protein
MNERNSKFFHNRVTEGRSIGPASLSLSLKRRPRQPLSDVPRTRKRSEMSDREKIDYQNKHGLGALLDLPD